MTNMFTAALEEHGALDKPELEIEYSYFIQFDQEQLDAVVAMASEGVEKLVFSETKLGGSAEKGYSRLRCYIRDEGNECEITTKKHVEGKGKLEYNDTISAINYEALVDGGESTVVRVRLFFPITRADGSVILKKDGSPLQWELDLYADSRGAGMADLNHIHPWAKIELEVDKATMDDVISHIPVEYVELLASDTKNEEDRSFIQNLYENDYNVKGKWKDPVA